MNEKIREFAIKSQIASEHHGELVSPYGQPCEMSEEVQEFAELMVLESAKWILDNYSSMEQLGPEFFAIALCNHFGIVDK